MVTFLRHKEELRDYLELWTGNRGGCVRIVYISYSDKQAYEFLQEIANKLAKKKPTVLDKRTFSLATDGVNIIALSVDSPKIALIGYPQPDYVCNCGYPDKYYSDKHYECVEQKIKYIETRFQEHVKYITEQELRELIGVV